MPRADPGTRVDAFNLLSSPVAQDRLLRCLAVPRWAADVADGRPYPTFEALRERAKDAASALTDEELACALSGHPRIGERPTRGHDTAYSRREQAGVDASDADVAARLSAGNQAYEQRFARVFIIRAAGRSAAEILTELTRRLANDDPAERAETTSALREIAVLRLESVV